MDRATRLFVLQKQHEVYAENEYVEAEDQAIVDGKPTKLAGNILKFEPRAYHDAMAEFYKNRKGNTHPNHGTTLNEFLAGEGILDVVRVAARQRMN